MSTPKCGKCLLTEFEMSEFAQTVREYISLIPQEQKTDENEYLRRLDICRDCDELSDGLCGECGCFVEIRAAKCRLGCPIGKWNEN